MCLHVLACACMCLQVWERPAIAVSHLPTGEKWAKGYDLQLRFYDIQQYPEVRTNPSAQPVACNCTHPSGTVCVHLCVLVPSWCGTNSIS